MRIKKVTLIKHGCLPILMLLYINAVCSACLLNAVSALSNAVWLHNASFLPMISAIGFYFHVLSWFIDT